MSKTAGDYLHTKPPFKDCRMLVEKHATKSRNTGQLNGPYYLFYVGAKDCVGVFIDGVEKDCQIWPLTWVADWGVEIERLIEEAGKGNFPDNSWNRNVDRAKEGKKLRKFIYEETEGNANKGGKKNRQGGKTAVAKEDVSASMGRSDQRARGERDKQEFVEVEEKLPLRRSVSRSVPVVSRTRKKIHW